jgi:aldehyde dehydrogenase (NAD+)
MGDPFDPTTTLGPLVAERQRKRVLGFIDSGVSEGAKLVSGGGRPQGQTHGWFVEPTVFAEVDNSMTIAREEIFGPVVSIIPYETEEEAVRIANDSDYGLGGAVHSADPLHGLEVARRIDTGYVAINRYGIPSSAPFGGVKRSGIGREHGPEGYDSFLEYASYPLPSDVAKELSKTVAIE